MVRIVHIILFPVKKPQPLVHILQPVAFGILRQQLGNAVAGDSRPVIRNLQQEAGFHLPRADPELAAAVGFFIQAMLDGVFHDRLDNQVGHPKRQDGILDLKGNVKGIAVDFLLDAQVGPDVLQLVPYSGHIAAPVEGGAVKL